MFCRSPALAPALSGAACIALSEFRFLIARVPAAASPRFCIISGRHEGSIDMPAAEQLRASPKPTMAKPVPDVVARILEQLSEYAATPDRMLPAACYTSQEFFEFERRYVFARSWICVGRIEQIPDPGDAFSTQVAGEPVLITRDMNGEINALAAICRHRGQVIPCTASQKT